MKQKTVLTGAVVAAGLLALAPVAAASGILASEQTTVRAGAVVPAPTVDATPAPAVGDDQAPDLATLVPVEPLQAAAPAPEPAVEPQPAPAAADAPVATAEPATAAPPTPEATAVPADAAAAPAAPAPAAAVPAAPAAPAAAPAAAAAPSTAGAAALFWALNDARVANGLPPLTYHSGLEAVAQPWSAHMASTGMAHNPSVSSQIPAGWRAWGENVAYAGGYPDLPATIHTNWMNSPGHRANILRSTFTHVGIGYHVAPDGSAWATQVFARY